MLKTKTVLELKAGERIYTFECANDSPLGEIYDVLSKMRFYVFQRLEEIEKSSKETSEKIVPLHPE